MDTVKTKAVVQPTIDLSKVMAAEDKVASQIAAAATTQEVATGRSEVPLVPITQLNAKDTEIERLKLLLIEERNNVTIANERIRKLSSLVADNGLIVLRANTKVLTVIVDGARHLFKDYVYKTADRGLANAIKAQYPNVTEDNNVTI